MQPYRQRQVFEVHPELSFYQLNDDVPMKHPKESVKGVAERKALVEARIPGIDAVLETSLPGVELRHLHRRLRGHGDGPAHRCPGRRPAP